MRSDYNHHYYYIIIIIIIIIVVVGIVTSGEVGSMRR